MGQSVGEFETHLTVEPGCDLEALKAWAQNENVKFTHIVLARGITASQPMLTFHGRGDLKSQLAIAESMSNEMQSIGCNVNRVKTEVGLNHVDVPISDADTNGLSKELYFEFHVKLKLPTLFESFIQSLTGIAIEHSAHLSRNAFRKRTDGFEERFVTQRCYQVGRRTAERRFEVLLEALKFVDGQEIEVLEVEKEFVVYDSNLSIDSGWMKSEQ